MPKLIPFYRPHIGKEEIKSIKKVLNSGKLSGNGPFTKKVEKLIKSKINSKGVFLTTSCTHSLEMAAILLDLKENDEVIVPSFTFVSTALAFSMQGARIRFVDVKEENLNLDENLLKNLINKNTKAIVPMHYGGISCEMDKIIEIARNNEIKIVEDNAHGFLGKYKNKDLGSFGSFSSISFHETKNITCGEGGALCVNEEEYLERAEYIRDKGTNRSKFLLGKIDKYTWVDKGSNYLPSELNAAILYEQVKRSEEIHLKREKVWKHYFHHLEDWSKSRKIKLPKVNENIKPTYHIFYLLMPNEKLSNDLLSFLNTKNIKASFHYQPLHNSPFIKKNGSNFDSCPNAESISKRIVRLPIYYDMTLDEVNVVISSLKKFK